MNINQIIGLFGGMNGFTNAYNNLGKQCQNNGIDPESKVREMLNNGQTSQLAFNRAAAIADMITGKKQF